MQKQGCEPGFFTADFGEQSEFNAHKCNKCEYRSIFFPIINKK